jgi:hypothetical protein
LSSPRATTAITTTTTATTGATTGGGLPSTPYEVRRSSSTAALRRHEHYRIRLGASGASRAPGSSGGLGTSEDMIDEGGDGDLNTASTNAERNAGGPHYNAGGPHYNAGGPHYNVSYMEAWAKFLVEADEADAADAAVNMAAEAARAAQAAEAAQAAKATKAAQASEAAQAAEAAEAAATVIQSTARGTQSRRRLRGEMAKSNLRGGSSTTIGSAISEAADRADGADRASSSEERCASSPNAASPLERMAQVAQVAHVATLVVNARSPVRRIGSAPQSGMHGAGQYDAQYLKATKKRGKLAQRIQRGYVYYYIS